MKVVRFEDLLDEAVLCASEKLPTSLPTDRQEMGDVGHDSTSEDHSKSKNRTENYREDKIDEV